MSKAITYVGSSSKFWVKFENSTYDFEWQKSLGVGGRKGEVHQNHALMLSLIRDGDNKPVFILE